ncbi:2'-5' RNA ligase family protein [Paenibacillus hexagrammi]|uniref:2'-5' RNA ligase family protein n=1 Tax=Paenibacillus hexagrammi TaxID=2908839 RepID=A0ABY3SSN6_9BACL|nr:2'-5' RNA ligase family protein [Paenibacillus sp. YPD9-1]UJF35997.1 2'-5' RNA ligase family protein [Paenibacillus sp. YPD9-1]
MRDKVEFHNTHIVLEMPSHITKQIISIRKQQKDDFRASLPVEITLAGSSGVGVLEPKQDSDKVFSKLHSIALRTAPIKAAFGKVLRFPNTDIFAFTIKDEGPFHRLHEQIADSGIFFLRSPYPYTPHCTLRSRSLVTEIEANELFGLQIPDEFVLDTMSVLSLYQDSSTGEISVPVLHKVKLSGTI